MIYTTHRKPVFGEPQLFFEADKSWLRYETYTIEFGLVTYFAPESGINQRQRGEMSRKGRDWVGLMVGIQICWGSLAALRLGIGTKYSIRLVTILPYIRIRII
jgi:hypothetical protein